MPPPSPRPSPRPPPRPDPRSSPRPTVYSGISFRSRLEARWAAFFDRLHWRWTYEPVKRLNRWIPDFALLYASRSEVLVEVKPDLSLPDLVQHQQRINVSGWRGEAVIVGGAPVLPVPVGDAGPALGLLSEPPAPREPGRCWQRALWFHCLACHSVSFHAADGDWSCRASGCHEGRNHVGAVDPATIHGAWAGAFNATRWDGPGAASGTGGEP